MRKILGRVFHINWRPPTQPQLHSTWEVEVGWQGGVREVGWEIKGIERNWTFPGENI